jgi:hypothetical protein
MLVFQPVKKLALLAPYLGSQSASMDYIRTSRQRSNRANTIKLALWLARHEFLACLSNIFAIKQDLPH